MRCPALKELPPPPPGKTGWPWTEESPQLPDTMQDGSPWPRISIVTPSLNQGRFIEETIRSVLLQGYPNLEYIIIDGGSTDNTIEIIKKYEKWITYWVSEPDRGQAHAINKGFKKAKGKIYAYINSDDLYEKECFSLISNIFASNPKIDLVTGECICFDKYGIKRIFKPQWPDDISFFLKPFGSPFPQPSSFWTSEIYFKVNGFNEDLHYPFDREFFFKLAFNNCNPYLIDKKLAYFREHSQSKSQDTIKFYEESKWIIERYGAKCGLSFKDIKKQIHKINNDISYLKTFSIWKHHGRIKAFNYFLQYLIRSPDFLFDRKVLGLLRRLFMFKEKDVVDLKYIK